MGNSLARRRCILAFFGCFKILHLEICVRSKSVRKQRPAPGKKELSRKNLMQNKHKRQLNFILEKDGRQCKVKLSDLG